MGNMKASKIFTYLNGLPRAIFVLTPQPSAENSRLPAYFAEQRWKGDMNARKLAATKQVLNSKARFKAGKCTKVNCRKVPEIRLLWRHGEAEIKGPTAHEVYKCAPRNDLTIAWRSL